MGKEGILGEAEYHIRRQMPSTTAGASPTLRHGGWWRPMGAASHRPHARSLRPSVAVSPRMPHKPSGQIPCQHGVYLKRFGHREDDKCWWCGGAGRTAAQTREHLFRHCSRWRDQQKTLWKAVGKAMGWKAGRCRHVQISELFSIEECDQAVMDFLAATDVGKFPPK